MFELAAFAESREYAKGQARQRRFVHDLANDWSLKNIGGRLMLEFTYLPYDFSIRRYWEEQDLRADLAARLQKT